MGATCSLASVLAVLYALPNFEEVFSGFTGTGGLIYQVMHGMTDIKVRVSFAVVFVDK